MSEKERREFLEAMAGISKDEYVTVSESDFTHAMAWAVAKEIEELEELAAEKDTALSTGLALTLVVCNGSATSRAWKLLTGKIKEEDEDE